MYRLIVMGGPMSLPSAETAHTGTHTHIGAREPGDILIMSVVCINANFLVLILYHSSEKILPLGETV